MKRRDFLKYTLASGAAALGGTGSLLKASRASEGDTMELEEITIAELQASMASGRETAVSIVRTYLQRIESMDKKGPAVNAMIELNPDAESIARELDEERKARGPRGPLHGIPVVLKDNIGTADGMMTTAGSLALSGSIPTRDAFIAEKLRKAGAVILGKTNLSEWANFRSTESTSGWSSRGGQTKNPYALDRNPCGSSSGSAVAVSANLCAVAVGTETDGSVVCPSNASGVVGIKPTLGLVSRTGIIPIAHSQDTAGPMGRTVHDAAILLGAMAGRDPRDPATRDARAQDYTRHLDPAGLEGARLGVARDHFGFNEDVDRIMEDALAVMKKRGAILVDPANLETRGQFGDSEFEVLLYEFKTDLNEYLAGLGPEAPVRTLEEIIAFNEKNRETVMPHFGQDIFYKAQEKGPLTERAYLEALEKNHRLSREEGIDATLAGHGVDALVAPTGGPAWLTDWINGDHFGGGSSSFAAVAGYPNVTVPAGFIHGLPVGISFFSSAYREPLLIKLAYAFEQATKARRPPGFPPSVGG